MLSVLVTHRAPDPPIWRQISVGRTAVRAGPERSDLCTCRGRIHDVGVRWL